MEIKAVGKRFDRDFLSKLQTASFFSLHVMDFVSRRFQSSRKNRAGLLFFFPFPRYFITLINFDVIISCNIER